MGKGCIIVQQIQLAISWSNRWVAPNVMHYCQVYVGRKWRKAIRNDEKRRGWHALRDVRATPQYCSDAPRFWKLQITFNEDCDEPFANSWSVISAGEVGFDTGGQEKCKLIWVSTPSDIRCLCALSLYAPGKTTSWSSVTICEPPMRICVQRR
jgi:hypothetical protein